MNTSSLRRRRRWLAGGNGVVRSSALVALFGLVAEAHPARADDLGAWQQVMTQVSLHPAAETGARLSLDLHARRGGDRFQSIVRPSLSYDLSQHISLWLGYSYVPLRQTAHDHDQHDLWQQVQGVARLGAFDVLLRGRVEARIDDDQEGVSVRVRGMARASHDLGEHLMAVVWDEGLGTLNRTPWVATGFNENRLFIGPGWRFGGQSRMEVGYLNQHILATGHKPVTDNHIVFMALNLVP